MLRAPAAAGVLARLGEGRVVIAQIRGDDGVLVTDIDNPPPASSPASGTSAQNPLHSLPAAPPTYDPARRLFAPLPDPVVQEVVVPAAAPAPWWTKGWIMAALATGIALAVAASVVTGFALLQDDDPQLVSLGGGSSVVGGANLALRGEALDVQGVLGVVSPSVVSIETNAETRRGLFGGSGSGVVVDNEGLVLTNAHVIDNADRIEVVFFDGTRAPATVVSSIVEQDIALLQTEGVTDTLPATLGTTEAMLVGDEVLAIGNALGLGGDPTVTLGILSAKNREINADRVRFSNLLQTDAAINPGNSGGPLVNAAGEVIGINTAIIDGAQNVGFAIAIDSVRPFLAGFAEGDTTLTAATAWFGASSRAVASVGIAQLEQNGITGDAQLDPGVFVIDVFAGSAAERAGLQPGDVIVGINNNDVAQPEDVARIIRSLDPGDSVVVEFTRRGEPVSGRADLGTRADAGN